MIEVNNNTFNRAMGIDEDTPVRVTMSNEQAYEDLIASGGFVAPVSDDTS